VHDENPKVSDRISASIPIHVSWMDRAGKRFSAEGRTTTISRGAATIVLPQKLEPPQEITIRKVEGGVTEVTARILGNIGGEGEWRIYGLMRAGPAAEIWDQEFPSEEETAVPERKVCLECASCANRAIVQLSEIEAEVLERRGLTNRLCRTCGSWTVWSAAEIDFSPERDTEETKGAETKESPTAREGGENRRKQARIMTKVSACIRYQGVNEEVVRVKDVSRGGFRFVSDHYYIEGSPIMVAIPYTPNAANIFVPARIMWRQEVIRLAKLQYGVAYAEKKQPSG